MPRDLFSEIGASQAVSGGRDLFAETGGMPVIERPKKKGKPNGTIVPRLVKGGLRTLGATAETAYSIAEGGIVWPISKAAGLVGLVEGGDTPKRYEEATARFLTHRPILKETEATMEKVGRGFEFIETPQRMAAQELERRGLHRTAYATKFLSDLAVFKFLHASGAKTKANILKQSIKDSKAVIPNKKKLLSEIDHLEKGELGEKLTALKEDLQAKKTARAQGKVFKQPEPKSAKESAAVFETDIAEARAPKARDLLREKLQEEEARAKKVPQLIKPTKTKALPPGQGFELKDKVILKKKEPGYSTPKAPREPEVYLRAPKETREWYGEAYKVGESRPWKPKPTLKHSERVGEHGVIGVGRRGEAQQLLKPENRIIVEKPKPKKVSESENLVTELIRDGGINFGKDWNKSEILATKDGKRLSKPGGKPIDEVVDELHRRGLVQNENDFINKMESGQLRELPARGKEDLAERRFLKKLEEEQNEVADAELSEYLARHDNEKALYSKFNKKQQEVLNDLKERPDGENLAAKADRIAKREVLSEIESQRDSLKESRDKALAEVSAFFDEKAKPAESKPRDIFEKIPKKTTPATVDFLGFQQMFDMVRSAIRKRKAAKIKPRLVKPQDVQKLNTGKIVKQRTWRSGTTNEKLTAPPVWDLEKKIIKELPELPNKPLGGWTENPIRTFEQLGENAKELFYRPVKEAEKRVTLEREATRKQIKEMFKGVSGKSSKRIGAFAISRQKRGEGILKSMGVKEVPKLTPEEFKVYKALRKQFSIYYNRLNKARRLSGKESFPKVDNYFTFFRDLSIIEQMGFNPITTKSTMIQKQFQHLKTTPFRFAKARAKAGFMPVELDAKEIFTNYAEHAIRHIHLSPAIAKGRELLLTFGSKKNKTRWILKEENPRTAKFLTEWLDFQAGQKPVTNIPTIIEKAAYKLNQNIAFALLSYNVRSALIQPSAFRNTVVEIGPKYWAQGIVSLFSPKQRKFALKESNVLVSRAYDVSATDAMQGIMKGKISKTKRLVGSVGIKPLQYLDLETAKATWTGAYHKARDIFNYSHKKAVNYADDLVTKTQASAMPSDVAPIQRTALGKVFTPLQTFVINEWGFLTRDVLGIKNANLGNVQAFKKTMAFIAATTMFNMLFEDVLGIMSPFPAPIKAYQDALEKGKEWPSLAVAKELAEQVPVVGGGLRYGTGALGATIGLIERVGRGEGKKEDIGLVLGVPGTRQVTKTIKAKKRGESTYGQVVGQYTKKKGLNKLRLKKIKKLKGL